MAEPAENNTAPAVATEKKKDEKDEPVKEKAPAKDKKTTDDTENKANAITKKRAAASEEDRPKRDKRERKSSNAFVPEDFLHVDASVKVIEGRGVKLSDIPAVRESIESTNIQSSIIDDAHKLCFKRGRKPPKAEMKQNLLDFSGFLIKKEEEQTEEELKEQDDDAEAYMGQKAYKLKVQEIKALCDFFAIDRSGKQDKDALVDCLLDFLAEPSEELARKDKKSSSGSKPAKAEKSPPSESKKKSKPTKKQFSKPVVDSASDDDEDAGEDSDGSEDDDDVPIQTVKKGQMPSDAALRRWVRAFIQCYDMEKATVKVALEVAGGKFGIDLSEKKKLVKEMLKEEMG